MSIPPWGVNSWQRFPSSSSLKFVNDKLIIWTPRYGLGQPTEKYLSRAAPSSVWSGPLSLPTWNIIARMRMSVLVDIELTIYANVFECDIDLWFHRYLHKKWKCPRKERIERVWIHVFFFLIFTTIHRHFCVSHSLSLSLSLALPIQRTM